MKIRRPHTPLVPVLAGPGRLVLAVVAFLTLPFLPFHSLAAAPVAASPVAAKAPRLPNPVLFVTQVPIPFDGTLTRLVYQTKEGTATTEMKVHVSDGTVVSVTLANINATFGGVETISVSVAAGDYVEIEYDADDKPGECTMYFILEPS